jgi:diphosphomevalonate decarboxylase
MKHVQRWRNDRLSAYFTIDAGPNVHILTLPEDAKEVEARLKEMPEVLEVIHSKPGSDAMITNKHLY